MLVNCLALVMKIVNNNNNAFKIFSGILSSELMVAKWLGLQVKIINMKIDFPKLLDWSGSPSD